MNAMVPAPCDPSSAAAARGVETPHPGWTLVATILASSLAFIDGSVINVALPAIGHSFAGTAADLQWTINAYLLPLSALLLLGGAAGDHYGRRRLLIFGTALFTVASIACALSPSLAVLLPARALQGIGAAILMPNSLAILGGAFSGDAKGRAVGTWAAAGAIAGAVGPPLGGWLVEVAGWRSIFLLNVPVALAAIAIAHRFVAVTPTAEQALDWTGATMATIALGILTWALTLWSKDYAMTTQSLIGIVLGSLLLVAFLVTEHRRGERAMMPLALFRSRAFVGLTVLTFLLYGALGGLLVLLPYLLIEAGGYTPLHAGMALLPIPLVIGLASRTMGRVAERIGLRWPLTAGPLVTGVGFLIFARSDPQASYWTSVLPALMATAIGMAGVVAPLTTGVLSTVDARHTGTASGFNSAVARTGGLIATALVGAVIAQSGAALVGAFHIAALIGVALSIASGIAGFVTLGGIEQNP